MLRSRVRAARSGFTVVELMVSAAICVVFMAILATCFQISMDTMRHMVSTGGMAEQLRSAATLLKRDLVGGSDRPTEHFLEELTKPNGGRLVRDQRADQTGWTAPRGGFFRVRSFNGTGEGSDPLGMGSSRGSGTRAAGNLLHFTSYIPAPKSDADYFYATVPAANGKTYKSRAAEIAYFLDPVPRGRTPAGLETFQLLRRQRLVAVTPSEVGRLPFRGNTALVAADQVDDPAVISLRVTDPTTTPPTYAVNTLADLVQPATVVDPGSNVGPANPDPRNFPVRMGGVTNAPKYTQPGNLMALGTPLGLTGNAPPRTDDLDLTPLQTRLGDDVVLSNVLSFEVKVLWVPGSGLASPRGFATNTDHPFDSFEGAFPAVGATPARVDFDTRIDPTTGQPPLAVRVKSLQIKLRIWDPKLQGARQVTLIEDL